MDQAQIFALDYLEQCYSLGKLMVDKDWAGLYAVLAIVADGLPFEVAAGDNAQRVGRLQSRIEHLRNCGWAQVDLARLAELAKTGA